MASHIVERMTRQPMTMEWWHVFASLVTCANGPWQVMSGRRFWTEKSKKWFCAKHFLFWDCSTRLQFTPHVIKFLGKNICRIEHFMVCDIFVWWLIEPWRGEIVSAFLLNSWNWGVQVHAERVEGNQITWFGLNWNVTIYNVFYIWPPLFYNFLIIWPSISPLFLHPSSSNQNLGLTTASTRKTLVNYESEIVKRDGNVNVEKGFILLNELDEQFQIAKLK